MTRLKRLLLALVVVAACVGAAYGWFVWEMGQPVDAEGGAVALILDSGATWDDAVSQLEEKGLVRYPRLFDLRARQRRKRTALQAGLFKLDSGMSPDLIMDRLAAGPDRRLEDLELRFQVIEGDNIWRIDQKLRRLGMFGLLALAKDDAQVAALGLPVPRPRPKAAETALEGYLFPETYFLDRKRPRLKTALGLATRQFKKVFSALKKAHRKELAALRETHKMSDHDLVTLASLIEKEVRAREEAAHVAGVFYNRLSRGMALQTDPTLVYHASRWREVPHPRHRRDATNPYNTYAHKGLPPGPICSPGRAALAAAMAPEVTEDLFFVAKRDGTGRSAFSKTLKEHQANIKKYLGRP